MMVIMMTIYNILTIQYIDTHTLYAERDLMKLQAIEPSPQSLPFKNEKNREWKEYKYLKKNME